MDWVDVRWELLPNKPIVIEKPIESPVEEQPKKAELVIQQVDFEKLTNFVPNENLEPTDGRDSRSQRQTVERPKKTAGKKPRANTATAKSRKPKVWKEITPQNRITTRRT